MSINLIPFAVTWAILALVIIALVVYRRMVGRSEDATLHVLDGDVARVPHQVVVTQKLESIDRWGKALTIMLVLYGLLLAVIYGYQSFTQPTTYLGR